MKQEIRFYTCLVLGFTLVVLGFYAPPFGTIDNSVIITFGMMLMVGALAVGIDVRGIIKEIRLLKESKKDENNV